VSVYDKEKEKANNLHGGEHDDLGMHPERREAEAADLEKSYGQPDAPEQNYGNRGYDSPDLRQAEEQAGIPAGTKADQKEQAGSGLRDTLGPGYKKDDKGSLGGRFLGIFKGKKKRLAIAGGAATILSGTLFGLFTFLHGPLQLVHLSQILGKFAGSNDTAIHIRTNGFMRATRAARTGDIAETRVGILGSKRFADIEKQLKDVGIEYERDVARTGRPTKMVIDTSKNPDFQKGGLAQRQAAIAKHFNVDIDKVAQISGLNGGKFAIPMQDLNIKATRALAFTPLKHIEGGTILNALNKRILAKYFNAPSLFKPMTRAKAAAENKLYARADRKVREKERSKKRHSAQRKKYIAAKNNVKNKMQPHRQAIGNTLLLTGAACTAKAIADDIPLVNYAAVVMPSMIEAVDKQAVGSQGQAQHDFDLNQLGDVVDTFKDDEGRTIWEAKGLHALASNTAGEGQDIDPSYRSAFSNQTTSANVREELGAAGFTTDIVCSPGGQLLQAGIGGLLIASGPGGWAAKTAQAGRAIKSGLVFGAIAGLVQQKIVDQLTEDVVESFAGPQGGNLLAYGARAGHNLNATSMGGVALEGTETRISTLEAEQRDREEFQSKSFFARMFDINDHRSLVASSVRATGPSPGRSISNLAVSLFNNPFKPVASSLTALAPKAFANTESYDWGSPLYSIPPNLLNDPKYDNPYENAERAAEILSGSSGQNYKDRARTCFGVTISQGQYGWDVTKEEEVNPADNAYVAAQCNNLGDENWVRILLFVFDTTITQLIDCFEGDETSCRQLTQGGSSQTGSSETAGSSIVGDPYTDSSSVACAPGTDDLGMNEAYNEGQKFTVRLCSLPNLPSNGQADNSGGRWSTQGAKGFAIVNSRVSGAWFMLVNDAKTAGINLTVNSSFRSMPHQQALFNSNPNPSFVARPGYSSHQAGVALDFNGMGVEGGSTCAARARMPKNPAWQWLHDNAERYGFKQYSAEAWHWDALPAANRCGAGQ
jgi:hypothetical protein